MNIAFVMDPLDTIDAETDSTIRLIHEAVLRNHTVGIIYSNNLTIRDSVTSAFCKIILRDEKIPTSTAAFHKRIKHKVQMLPLACFDAIFLRSNPPIDNVMLNFLDSVKGDTFIINDIDGIRKANNKLYTAAFSDSNQEIIPKTHVSKNKEYLLRMIEESPNDKMILKPLNGFGGSGVIVLERGASQNINSLLDFYIHQPHGSHYVILQDYVAGAEAGDVRILMLNGQPIGAMRRVPAPNDLRSNVHAGGSVVKHNLSKKEKLICKQVGPRLIADGLYLAGLDIIGDKLIEVNVLSPGGITRINKLNRCRLQKNIIDFVEEVINNKQLAQKRKSDFRKVVEDAKIDY
jgi:glutathione synthase